MGELTKHLELEQGGRKTPARDEWLAEALLLGGMEKGDPESRLTRIALARFLEELAPTNYRARQWGSLRRVRLSDNSHRWLCEACAKRVR